MYRGVRLAGALAVAAALLCGPAPASASPNVAASFEGETMSAPAGDPSGPIGDPTASNGTALGVFTGGQMSKTVTLSGVSPALFLDVRGDQCLGAPHLQVTVDGQVVYETDVANTTYRELGRPVSIAAGTHVVGIRLTNDARNGVCDRNLIVDRVTLYGEPFAATSFRNRPLSATEPLDPQSSAMAQNLASQVNDLQSGAWINTTQYSFPLYVVGRDQSPLFDVGVYAGWMGPTYPDPPYDQYFKQVPIPTDSPLGAQHSDGEDAALGVWQPASDRVWEFLGAKYDPVNGYQVHKGGRIDNLSTNPGYQTAPAGNRYLLSASGIANLAAVMRIPELQRGEIDHAVMIGIPDPKFAWCWPGEGYDNRANIVNNGYRPQPKVPGGYTYRELIPYGTRFRLPASLDVDALHLPRVTATIAKAAQRYGLVVTDFAGAVALYGEDWRTGWPSDPYRGSADGLFEGKDPATLLKDFPWSQLQALLPDSGGDGSADCGT
jgi:hypothetical protein